jgi:protein phosphatase
MRRKGKARAGRVTIEAAGHTDPGSIRELNEDSILVRVATGEAGYPDRALLVVADGVGGAPAGDVASDLAVETLGEGFERVEHGEPGSLLGELLSRANDRILSAGERNAQQRGMACALVAAVVRRGELWLANIGDSRAYLLRDGSLRQLTKDHSLAADQSLAPALRRVAKRPGAGRILTRSLGGRSEFGPDISDAIALQPGDVLLLCSDGLYNVLSERDLTEALWDSRSSVDDLARRLVALANERGAPDNVSAIVARANSRPMATERPEA